MSIVNCQLSILALVALAGFIKAFRDGVAFRPARSRLADFMPNFFGPNNWRIFYKNGAPNQGYRWSQIGMAWRTPFVSGWHLLDALQIFCFCIAITLAKDWPWYMAPILWLIGALSFSSIWKTPITELPK